MTWHCNALTANINSFDTPPPGAGLKTVIFTSPAVSRSVEGIFALTSVALTTVVGRGLPFHCTTEPAMKLDPVTVSVNGSSPAIAEEGFNAVIAGTGLGCSMMVNVNAFDAPPPGARLTAVTLATPTLAMSVAGILAINSVALLNVVGRAAPFQFTTAPFTNALPLTVKLN